LDRFEQGLPDPQSLEPVDECATCQSELYNGEDAWRYDGDLYCSLKCLADGLGAVELKIEKGEM
jgi:hypothetical protein